MFVRKRLENMVLGGLWFSDKKPVMSTFLKPFRSSLEDLETKGNWIHGTSETALCTCTCICCGISFFLSWPVELNICIVHFIEGNCGI